MNQTQQISHFHVSFNIYDFDCSAEELTKRIGLIPTEVRIKGETRLVGKKKIKRVNKENVWMLKSILPPSTPIEEHIISLLNILEPHKKAIIDITKKYYTEFGCGLYFYETNPGIHFDNEILKKISELNAKIDLDMYCLGDDSEK